MGLFMITIHVLIFFGMFFSTASVAVRDVYNEKSRQLLEMTMFTAFSAITLVTNFIILGSKGYLWALTEPIAWLEPLNQTIWGLYETFTKLYL